MTTRTLGPVALAILLHAANAEAQIQLSHDLELYENQPVTAAVTWIATWNFEGGSPCNTMGWTPVDERGTFGKWGRLQQNITDNDLCTGNITCAWLFSDNTTPTFAGFAHLSYGPGAHVVLSGIDNSLTSPWTTLAATPNQRTWLEFDIFPGNNYEWSRLALNISVRTRTGATVSDWQGEDRWYSLGASAWLTRSLDITCLMDPEDSEVQIRFRVSDMQLADKIGAPSILSFGTGPGPYLDNVRLGREPVSGPVLSPGIDSRSQAQDAFATQPATHSGPPSQEAFEPLTGADDRFGTAAFSSGGDTAINGASTKLITGDSITVCVTDARNSGGITAVDFYGCIIEGPHAGKAPAPYTVGASGCFVIAADPVRDSGGQIVPGHYFVDMDDTYFRGGDVLQYFWLATDQGGGMSSLPEGLTAVPASVSAAALATGGLYEVNFLPTIDWDPTYLARIAADPNGDLEPTPTEISNSSQAHEVLVVQKVDDHRRSGPLNRTDLMHALDVLSYDYDVYDVQGFGNTNNDLAGRATVQQATGYGFIFHDSGRRRSGTVPDGSDPDAEKLDQVSWYETYLANGFTSEASVATLMLIGENTAEELDAGASTLLNVAGVTLDNREMPANTSRALGLTTFTFSTGNNHIYSSDPPIPLALLCISLANADLDDLAASGSGVVTHEYGNPGSTGDGAVVMNTGLGWNTVVTSFAWANVVTHVKAQADPPGFLPPGMEFLGELLTDALPGPGQPLEPTDTGIVPIRSTLLMQNQPNPFNPSTRIRFQLKQAEHVRLQIFDVAGRLVRSLIDHPYDAGRHEVTWNGKNTEGSRVASGVYVYRMVAGDFASSKRMVVLQ